MHLSLYIEDGRVANATRKGGHSAPVTVSGFVAIGGVKKVDTSSGSEGGSNQSCLCIRYRVFCSVMFVTVEVINF
jgi:hypothetical protein